MLIENPETPALAFPEEPVLEPELDEPVEELELFPDCEDKEPSCPDAEVTELGN